MAHVAYKVADVTYFRHTLPRILIRANVITELDAITDDDGDIVDCEDCGDWFISELPNEVTLGSWNYVKNVDCYERIDKDE